MEIEWYGSHPWESLPCLGLSFDVCPVRLYIVQVCECRGGRPGLSVLTSLMVSVDVKLY